MHNLAVLDADGGQQGRQLRGTRAQWFRKAAERGVADSQFNLGILYARGIGVEQNLAESFKWFSLAAAQGDATRCANAKISRSGSTPKSLGRQSSDPDFHARTAADDAVTCEPAGRMGLSAGAGRCGKARGKPVLTKPNRLCALIAVGGVAVIYQQTKPCRQPRWQAARTSCRTPTRAAFERRDDELSVEDPHDEGAISEGRQLAPELAPPLRNLSASLRCAAFMAMVINAVSVGRHLRSLISAVGIRAYRDLSRPEPGLIGKSHISPRP